MTTRRTRTTARRGFTTIELSAVLGTTLIATAILVPVVARGSGVRGGAESLDNLRILHEAQVCYTRDWGGRQFTAVPDDLGAYGGHCDQYADANGCSPPLIVGWNCQYQFLAFRLRCDVPGLNGYCSANQQIVMPLRFVRPRTMGSFRVPNARPLHDYVDGRFYSPVFYARDDALPYAVVEPWLALDCEYAAGTSGIVPSTYVLSPAAMYHPDVFRAPSDGGFRSPDDLPHGYASPAADQVRYAHLKSRMMEHHWLRDPPLDCHPVFHDSLNRYSECQPLLFNHGADARPATSFFDGSTRFVRTGDVAEADAKLRAQTASGDGLWSHDTPLGEFGYFGDFALDGTNASHHILTTDGILGRDVLSAR